MLNILIMIAGPVAIIYSMILLYQVFNMENGNSKMQSIAKAIRIGAYAYIKKQSSYIAIFSLIIAIGLSYMISIGFALVFLAGAFSSCLAGIFGMYVAVHANVRTTHGCSKSLKNGFNIAVMAGGVTGFFVVGLAFFSISLCYVMHNLNYLNLGLIVSDIGQHFRLNGVYLAFCLGASFMSVFARIGGGIFTKGADVGADLSGKLEYGLPEDDPRNPAVIADSVGDNVGDCAGMAADLYETYVAIMACILELTALSGSCQEIMILAMGAFGLIASMIGFNFIRLKDSNLIGALYKGLLVSLITVIWPFVLLYSNKEPKFGPSYSGYLYASIIGCGSVFLIMKITEYYTSEKYKPVQSIAAASKSGHGTNVIQGLAVSLESTFLPMLLIIFILCAGQMFCGTAMAMLIPVFMLSSAPIIMTLDAYGPITDNAGGIAEMSKCDASVRKNTDLLDSVGNVTKAVTKGYAVITSAAAAVCFLSLLEAYSSIFAICYTMKDTAVLRYFPDIYQLSGMFLGAGVTNLFISLCMSSVSKAGMAVVKIVDEQLKNKRIIEGKEDPDYAAVVSKLTSISVRYMIAPALLCLTPLLIYLLNILEIVEFHNLFKLLSGFIVGNLIIGIPTALSMTAGGGAFDNAKKYIELGAYGGKGSDAHKASITGDTVGDPYKDTAGPALNPMIKSINIITVIILIMIITSVAN